MRMAARSTKTHARHQRTGVRTPGVVRGSRLSLRFLRTAARSAAPLLLAFAGCLSLPLPDQGPDRIDDLPETLRGKSAKEVRALLGAPDLLDTPTHRIYEWATDRRVFVTAAIPSGLPVGGIAGGRRFRALVRFDGHGAVASVDVQSSDAGKSEGATLETSYRLVAVPELAGVVMTRSDAGSGFFALPTLSQDGRVLALIDQRNRVWVLDVDSRRAHLAHEGRSRTFLSSVGTVSAALSARGDSLLVAQRQGLARRLERDSAGRFALTLAADENDVAKATFGTNGKPVRLTRRGELRVGAQSGIIAVQVDLKLGVRGPRVARAARAGEYVVARVDGAWLQPDQALVLTASGRGLATFDTRRPEATGWGPPGLLLSPCGRWLAHNSGRHVELWRCAELVSKPSSASDDAITPEAVFVMAQAHLDEDWLEPAAAIAFSSDSRLVAAATATSITVWCLDDGRRLARLGPLPLGFDRGQRAHASPGHHPLRVCRLALTPEGRLTALLKAAHDQVYLAVWRVALPPPAVRTNDGRR